MSKISRLTLSLVATMAIMALSAIPASAKISFEWFVGGSLLKAGEQRTFEVNSDAHNFDFHSTLAGAEILFLSNKIKVEKALILGGKPGTNQEVIVFENVTVDKPTSGCTIESLPNPQPGVLRTGLLKTEIVEGENGEVLILFSPKEGTAFTTLLLLGATCTFANIPAELTGSFLGLPLPQRTEVLRQNVVFPSVENKFFLSTGVLNTAGLKFAGNPLTFSGLTLIILTSDAVFGPF
jgi:hypothetical protein